VSVYHYPPFRDPKSHSVQIKVRGPVSLLLLIMEFFFDEIGPFISNTKKYYFFSFKSLYILLYIFPFLHIYGRMTLRDLVMSLSPFFAEARTDGVILHHRRWWFRGCCVVGFRHRLLSDLGHREACQSGSSIFLFQEKLEVGQQVFIFYYLWLNQIFYL